jgi:cytochrome c oxidase assembly factor CtaG
MRALLGICILVLCPIDVLAHDAEGWLPAIGWNLDPWLGLPLVLSLVLYAAGIWRLWHRAGVSRGIQAWQAVCFLLGWTSLAAALFSPLYRLGEGLFVAHMIEHEIVMIIAAPLIAVARPFGAMFWALPDRSRATLGALTRSIRSSSAWRVAGNAWFATALQALALWVWHAPALYDAVLVNPAVHRLQHLSFFLTALLFWWTLIDPRARPSGYGMAVLCLFVTTLQSGFLGVLLTLSRQPWYARQGEFALQHGLTPIEDQQLAGLVMWVPAGLAYTAAALVFAGIWISSSSRSTLSGNREAVWAR